VVVDPQARCDSGSVGPGTVIWAFAHVADGAVVGRSCKIGEHSYLEGGSVIGDRVTVKNAALIWEGVRVGDDVFLGPRVTFTNDRSPRAHRRREGDDLVGTVVEDGASLGASVTVVCGVTIGHDALVGAGSLVHRDVAPHALVVGVPARQVGWVCRCGDRLDDRFECTCGRRYARQGTSGLVAIPTDHERPTDRARTEATTR
jgi:acetyltransferase-like isoleucine patch superfamily enzyme